MVNQPCKLFTSNAARFGYEIAGLLAHYRLLLWQRRNTRDTLAPEYDGNGNMVVTLPGHEFYANRTRLLAELETEIGAMKAEIGRRFAGKVEKCTL
jgi:hypothetical protein